MNKTTWEKTLTGFAAVLTDRTMTVRHNGSLLRRSWVLSVRRADGSVFIAKYVSAAAAMKKGESL